MSPRKGKAPAEPTAPAPERDDAPAPAGEEDRYLLVQSGEDFCALPLARIRRIVRDLDVTPLPGTSAALKGLAEFGGEPLPVLDLEQVVGASPGATPPYSATVIAWAGPWRSRELIGLAVDLVLEVVSLEPESTVAGGEGVVRGEANVGDRAVRVISLAALGRSA